MKFPKERQYPKTVRVRTATYKIKFVNYFRDDPLCVGLHQGPEKLIKIKRQSEYEMANTFFHELCHAFEYQYDLKIKHKDIYTIANAICRYLKANRATSKSKSTQRRTRTRRKSRSR